MKCYVAVHSVFTPFTLKRLEGYKHWVSLFTPLIQNNIEKNIRYNFRNLQKYL